MYIQLKYYTDDLLQENEIIQKMNDTDGQPNNINDFTKIINKAITIVKKTLNLKPDQKFHSVNIKTTGEIFFIKENTTREQPKNCFRCPFNHSDCFCPITKDEIDRDDGSTILPCPLTIEINHNFIKK